MSYANKLMRYWFRSISFYSGVQTRQYYVRRDDKTASFSVNKLFTKNDRYYCVNIVEQPNTFDKDIFPNTKTQINTGPLIPIGGGVSNLIR